MRIDKDFDSVLAKALNKALNQEEKPGKTLKPMIYNDGVLTLSELSIFQLIHPLKGTFDSLLAVAHLYDTPFNPLEDVLRPERATLISPALFR